MGVAKLSSSGKQFQFIADDGTVYCTSTAYMKSLLYGHMKTNFILFNKFPLKASPDRFKPSPVYDPSGKYKEVEEGKVEAHKDSFSKGTRDNLKQQKVYKDKVIQWQ